VGTPVAKGCGMPAHARLLLPIVLLLELAASRPARAARRESVAASARVAAGAGLVVMARGRELQLFTVDGRAIARRATPVGDPLEAQGAGERAADESRERILDLLDVPTEARDSQAAEDLVEDELTLGERRAARALERSAADATPPAPIHLAASARFLWIATADGLWRAEIGETPRRIGPRPAELRALGATDDGDLLVLRGRELLASRDGGLTFQSLERLAARATHLAVPASGRWLAWAEESAVLMSSAAGRAAWPLPGTVRDLRACGDELVALTDDGLYRASADAPLARIAGPLPARRLACSGDGGGPWLAVGPGLLASADHGRSWRSRLDTPPGPVQDAAVAAEALWLATPAGLVELPIEESPGERPPALPPLDGTPGLALRGRPPVWAALLPRITLQGSYRGSPGRHEVRALALADFPLGPRQARPPAGALQPAALLAAQDLPPAPTPPPVETPAAAEPPTRLRPPPPDAEIGCLVEARARAVEAALAEPERARSYVVRAGRAAWLPELRLRIERRTGRSESLDLEPTSSTSTGPLGVDTANDVRYEARATWDLSRLVFSPDEMAAGFQALRMADMRREIESQVNRLYFERRRLLVEPPPTRSSTADHARRAVRVEELDAELDALSDGAFSRCRRPAEVPHP
jgi:hypothetical protein